MTETGSPSPYAGSDDTVGEAAQPDLMSGQHVIKPVPPETAGETIPANPPSGENVIEVKCCPSAVEFFGAVVHSDPKHFGYDPVNNRTLPNEDSPVYWYVGPQKNKVDIEYGTLSEPASRTDVPHRRPGQHRAQPGTWHQDGDPPARGVPRHGDP